MWRHVVAFAAVDACWGCFERCIVDMSCHVCILGQLLESSSLSCALLCVKNVTARGRLA